MTRFTIVLVPVKITFTCPYCDEDVSIPWENVNAPKYWGESWGDIECPECGERVEVEPDD